jgi:catechol 2,3-dioxygenase-like lactoylglutathione lyase family enzyme
MAARPHINLPVRDLEAAIDFYSKVFATSPSKVRPDYANFRLTEPALHLALVHQPDFTGKDPALDFGQHFGIELFDDADLAAWKDRVTAAGVLPHREEEAVTCCYAVADKFWLQDPDGNDWEFWVRHDDEGATLASSDQTATCCAPAEPEESACCAPQPTPTGGCCG